MRWNLYTSPPRTIVCPALLPPWKRITRSACSASRSVTLPFPSSPHWAPKTTIPGTTESVGASAASAERRPRRIPALAQVWAEERQLIGHLHEARDRAAADLLLERVRLD